MLVYQYYSEGFFGYGQEGDFHPYGIWHLIPLLLLAAAVYFTWKNHARLKGWKYEGRFRYLLSFVMLMAEMAYYWRLLYVGDEYGEFQMLTKLPIQVCQWGLICCVYMITSQNDTLFGINFLSLWAALGLRCSSRKRSFPVPDPAIFDTISFGLSTRCPSIARCI